VRLVSFIGGGVGHSLPMVPPTVNWQVLGKVSYGSNMEPLESTMGRVGIQVVSSVICFSLQRATTIQFGLAKQNNARQFVLECSCVFW